MGVAAREKVETEKTGGKSWGPWPATDHTGTRATRKSGNISQAGENSHCRSETRQPMPGHREMYSSIFILLIPEHLYVCHSLSKINIKSW
jgi:hypothetical protein